MEKKRLVFTQGKEDCHHDWAKRDKKWEGTEEEAGWQYSAETQVCARCGREELLGGTVRVPEVPGKTIGAEYMLEPDGNRGFSNYISLAFWDRGEDKALPQGGAH